MRRIVTASTAAMLVLLAACGDDGAGTGTANPSAGSPPAASAGGAPPAATDFDPATFHDATTVDNRWFPLVPGTQMTWEGYALDGQDKLQRKVIF
ncbi:MAG: hypothetical protein M3O29_05215, partial [Actinomycetota bacterium]|nr:hypothetical protein [Actinomycetota bacterium]